MTVDAPPAPKPRRRWRRRLLVGAGILLVLVVLAPLALSLPFVRGWVAGRLGAALGCEVSIEGASAFWGRGIHLEGITVRGAEGFDGPLAVIERVDLDVDVPALLGGRLVASARVVRPDVTLRRDEAGRRNTQGLMPASEEPEAEEEDGADLDLVIEGGRLRAVDESGGTVQALEDLALDASLSPDGAVVVEVRLVARDAAAAGGDATIEATAVVDGRGQGPVSIEVPALDLARLARLAADTLGIEDLRGRLQLRVDAQVRPEGLPTGQVAVDARDLAWRTADGVAVALAELGVSGGRQGEDPLRLDVRVVDVSVRETQGPQPRAFTEPEVTLAVELRHDADASRIDIATGALRAGQAFLATVQQEAWIAYDDGSRAEGTVDVHADLARLAGLRAFVPALEDVERGRLGLRLVANAAEGLDVRLGGWLRDLRIAPNEAAPAGYAEEEVRLQAHVRQPPGEPLEVEVGEVTSRMLRVVSERDRPFRVRMTEQGVSLAGVLRADLDLGALTQVLGGALGLPDGERMSGVVTLRGEAGGDADEGRLEAALAGRDIRLPPSWSPAPGTLSGRGVLAWTRDDWRVGVEQLSGFGVVADGTAVLGRGEAAAGLRELEAHYVADLTDARGLLAAPLALEPGDALAGRLEGSLALRPRGEAEEIEGQATFTHLTWRTPAGGVVLDEARAVVHHDVTLGPAPGRLRFDDVRVESLALEGTLAGTIEGEGDAQRVDVALRASGRAARLAALLRRHLGDDYDDLGGDGTYQARLLLRGPVGEGGAALLVPEGRLEAATWTTGGVRLEEVVLTATRARREDRLAFDLGGRINGGRTSARLDLAPGPGAIPWSARLAIQGMDTSSLLVDRGLGRYLTWVLPTLLPTEADAPVLSGRLDAEVPSLAADDLSGDALTRTLRGEGSLHMTRGTIADSTLFAAVGGGDGLGRVGGLLVQAVPAVRRVLRTVATSLRFSELRGRFAVADGRLTLSDGRLDGETLDLGFSGTVGLLDERLDLRVPVTLEGDAGRELGRVLPGGTIPLKVGGTLDSPRPTPDLDASDLAGAALGGGRDAVDRLRDLLGR